MRGQPHRHRPHFWHVIVLATILCSRAGSQDAIPVAEPTARPPWSAYQPIPIAVNDGRTRFQLPTTSPTGTTVLLISTLSKSPGPFPVKVSAVSTSQSAPLPIARDPALSARPLKPPLIAPVASRSKGMPAGSRTFHVLVRDGDVASPSNYLGVVAILRAIGTHVQVYVDSGDAKLVTDDVLRDLVATFDERVFPTASKTFGTARDVDGDGRFTILMSSWLSRLGGGRHAVDGYVRGADLDMELDAPFSNRCDMMYLNAQLEPGAYVRTILAHEYTHAVTYTAKLFNGPRGERAGIEEEGWLDEGLAHLGEDLHGFARSNIDYRISAFLASPERYRLVVEDYFAADLFRSHGNRGGTYLFLRWCADRYGPNLLPTLARSKRRGIESLENATGTPFTTLFRRWSTATYLSGLDPAVPCADGYRSVDLRGTIEGWELGGPRYRYVAPNAEPKTLTIAGTSSQYVMIEPPSQGNVEVEIVAPIEAKLQVTAVPLPDDVPRPELTVKVSEDAGGLNLRAELRERGGHPFTLTALTWEPVQPLANPRCSGFQRGAVRESELLSAFGSRELPSRGHLTSNLIRLKGVDVGAGPLVFRVVGTDKRGRRITAWANADRPTDDDARPALAGGVEPRNDRSKPSLTR